MICCCYTLGEEEMVMEYDLTDEQIALADKGFAILSDLTNVAYGTPGWNVKELVRKGAWKLERRERCPITGYWNWHYGPNPTVSPNP